MSLRDFLDDRTGYRKLMNEALDEPVVGGARFAYVWGSALSLSFVIQAVTGILLMTAYQPSATTAWSSVAYIQQQMSMGWLIRGLHHFGAQAMVILLVAHLGQTAVYGAYKKPREMNWLLGLALMGVTLGFALTGYLLPWDQKGYWATKVATNIAATIPVLGGSMQRLLVGGSDYGHLTLTRFYTLHVAVLPLLMIGLIAMHIALFRKHGVTPAATADRSKIDRFFPKQVGIDLVVAALVLAAIYFVTLRNHGAPLDAPADPASNYPARPEWYFLALFEALKYVPGNIEWIVAAGIPLVVGGYLVALPFLDKKESTALRPRLGLLAPLALLGLGAAALTFVSVSSDAKDKDFLQARQQAQKQADRALVLAKRGVPPAGPLHMLATDPRTQGPILFAKHCAACHQLGTLGPPKGKQTAPKLDGFGTKAWVLEVLQHPDADHLFGKTPFAGMMPSLTIPPKDKVAAEFFTPMKKADQDAIALFLEGEALGTNNAKNANQDWKTGEKLVKRRCTSCHRLDGQSDNAESLAPELRGWGSERWIAWQIANPGSGKTYPAGAMAKELKGHMPGYADQLSESQIKLLARWVFATAVGRKIP